MISTISKTEVFVLSWAEKTGESLGKLVFWLPVIYFGRNIWIHLIDVIGSHVH